jgi:hypothetical protein
MTQSCILEKNGQPEDGASVLLRNVDIHLRDYKKVS